MRMDTPSLLDVSGLERASALSGLSFWLVHCMIAVRATRKAGFLWLGVAGNRHGWLHTTAAYAVFFIRGENACHPLRFSRSEGGV